MNLNGGYAMIKHDATQNDLAVAYKTKRPVLLYDADNRAHWAQINEKVIETVDEETQETITTYEYSYQLLNAVEALVDDSGNPRFIEGKGTIQTMEGVTITYNKWSLSGTHLMCVVAGSVANGTVMNGGLTHFKNIPAWILNKIYVVWANVLERKTVQLTASNYTSQNATIYFGKQDDYLYISIDNVKLTDDRYFRIQFDLLIDNE